GPPAASRSTRRRARSGWPRERPSFPTRRSSDLGLVAYRDRGDDYITRIYDFTQDVSGFQANLNSVSAGGGGDTPESLNEALHHADRKSTRLSSSPAKTSYAVSCSKKKSPGTS